MEPVNETAGKDELSAAIERENYPRAAVLGTALGLPEGEIQNLRLKALWQMAAVYRNTQGTKKLAEQIGLSKQELGEFLEKHAEEKREEGTHKPLDPCFDLNTGEYLTFEQWLDHLLKQWDKLSIS